MARALQEGEHVLCERLGMVPRVRGPHRMGCMKLHGGYQAVAVGRMSGGGYVRRGRRV